MNFKDKNVYIPGGSSGIGLSAAQQLAALGAHVIIFARNQQRLEKAVEQIKGKRKDESQRVLYMQLDVSNNDLAGEVMTKAVADFGVPDILINCAGRAYPHYFHDVSFKQFDETMKINLYGTWSIVAALVPHMKIRGGHIINVSSMAGVLGVFGYTDYSASKFAVIGFSEALRSELKSYNILVSVLCPADTNTPGFEEENKTKPPETVAISETASVFTPDEMARGMIKKIGTKKFIIAPGVMSKLTILLKRLIPGLVEFIMDSDIKKVQKKLKSRNKL